MMSGVRKRHALGQHFLVDTSIARALVTTALRECETQSCKTLMEIGPGPGALTHVLLECLPELAQAKRPKNFLLVEKDPKLAQKWLQHASSSHFSLQVEAQDFLTLNEKRWLELGPIGVVSNLPYSVGTPILMRLAQHPKSIPFMLLMFQSEVAQRIVAAAGTRHRGSLSLAVQNDWDVQTLYSVPPRAFAPPPQVQSEVILLRPRTIPRIALSNESKKQWEQFLKVAFTHKRKMLRSIRAWRNALEEAHVDGTKRAEALEWEEWIRLFSAVQKNTVTSLRSHST